MHTTTKSSLVLLALTTTLSAFAANDITVTSGKFQGSTSLSGTASVVERNDKRFLDFKWSKAPVKTVKFRLVKKESLSTGAFPTGVEFVELGTTTTSVPISKSLDVWLYRSVAAIDAKGNVIAFANLRSAQEKGR
ncbi:MAG: hypothetical protein KIT11_04740 [Fimbriimonadaceae bacterium]|nr:hypothetical protein [Fimbriimonadaceae bacterium]QYK56800.1 MAG: hypothetical protein KF733_04785 [Fimbriimonadaceae bacterium]